MKISEIRDGMGNVSVVARVVEIGEPREVMTRFGPATVATAVLEDETGRIMLSLWRDQIGMVKVGDLVSIQGAFVRSFRNQLQLNVGRRGRITVLERASKT